MVGSANGRSIKASRNHFPGNLTRTSTQAMATPMTALIAATESDSHKESRMALIAAGWVMSCQKVPNPVVSVASRMNPQSLTIIQIIPYPNQLIYYRIFQIRLTPIQQSVLLYQKEPGLF